MAKDGLKPPEVPFENEYPLGSRAPDAYTPHMREANNSHRRLVQSLPSRYVEVELLMTEAVIYEAQTAAEILQRRAEAASETTEAA